MADGLWLIAFVAAQRVAELALARRNGARLKAAGAVEFGARHYPLIVALHVAWLGSLLGFGYGRTVDPGWLALFIVLQVGRLWVLTSLGPRWTTRILVVRGAAPVRRGPYRFLRHPNYLVVALEIAVVPLALGLPLVALVFFLANAGVLAWRIRLENQALAWAAGENVGSDPIRPATLANG